MKRCFPSRSPTNAIPKIRQPAYSSLSSGRRRSRHCPTASTPTCFVSLGWIAWPWHKRGAELCCVGGNFQQIVRIALEALRSLSPQTQVWELTLVEAFQASAVSVVEPLNLPALEGLPDAVKKLLDREHVLRTSLKPGSRAPAMSELAPPAPSTVAVYQIVTSLVLSGHPADALAFLDRFGKVLDTRTLTSLRLDGFAAQGWPELRQSEIDAILRHRLAGREWKSSVRT